MFAYKTNSSDYLDYVASVKTREQILADPDLCLLLQNPFIKDNTEMAIRWNKAKHGSYQDKYDFMQYFMCNGPQLDADTILHYRAKAYSDPVCMEIAYSYLSDTAYISEIRESKYQKETDNCFKNPCFYMGKFSSMMGNCGDTENTRTAFNCIAKWWQACWGDGKEQELVQAHQVNVGQRTTNTAATQNAARESAQSAQQASGKGEKVLGTDTKVDPAASAKPSSTSTKIPPPPPPGMIRKCFMQVLHPSIVQGWGKWWAQVSSANEAFSEQFMNCTNTALVAGKVGDYLSQPISEMLDIVTKANVKRQLGDCARLWSHVRRFRLFGSDNKYGPVVANQLVGDTNTDGTPTETVANPQPKAGDSTKPLKRKRKNSAKKKKGTKKNDPYAKYRTASGAIDMDKLSEENPELYQKMMAEEEAAYKYVDRYGVAHTSEASRDEANAMVVGTPMSDKGVDAMQGFLNAMAEKQEREQREIAQKALNNSLTGQVYNSGNSVPTAVTDAFKINVPSVPDTRVSPLDIIPTKDR